MSIYFKKKQCLYLIVFFFGEIISAVCFWKMHDDNNCNIYMFRSCFVVQNFCLFSAIFAMLRSIFLHRPGHPADVPTSGDFLCCQIIRYLLHPSPCDLLSLRWLHQQTTGHLDRWTLATLIMSPLAFCRDVTSALKKYFSTSLGRHKKSHYCMHFEVVTAVLTVEICLGFASLFQFSNISFSYQNCP